MPTRADLDRPKVGASRREPSTLERIDRWLALSWWWKWKLARAERRLANTLSTHDERSFQAAAAFAAVQRAQFAIDYGRGAEPAIQRAVAVAAEAGVPTDILRLIVMNVDLRITKDGRVRVRRSWWLTGLAWVSRLLVVAAMAHLSALTFELPLAWSWKVVVLSMYGATFFVIAYTWDLFGVRAVRAVRLFGEHVEAAIDAARTGDDYLVMNIRDG